MCFNVAEDIEAKQGKGSKTRSKLTSIGARSEKEREECAAR